MTKKAINNRVKALQEKQQAQAEQEKLNETKNNINSNEYIEQIAREKLGMYLPNERVYIDIGK